MSERVALIVGIGPGLGASLAKKLAGAGYRVAGAARGAAFGEKLAEEVEGMLHLSCDATDAAQVKETLARVEKELGAPSVLIYNPGMFHLGSFLQTSPAQFEALWRVNFLGAVHFAQAVLPPMLKAGRGSIVFSGATAAIKGSANFSAFAASKFALRALAQSLAREFGPKGVHVAHVVIDGVIWSERTKTLFGAKRETTLDPDAIAESYLHLLGQDRSAWTQELDLRPDVEKF